MRSELATSFILAASLGCRQPPASEGTDSNASCQAQSPAGGACEDGSSSPGEFCLEGPTLYEAEIQPGVPAPMPAELLVGDFDGDGYTDLRAERLTLFGGEELSSAGAIGAGEVNVAAELDTAPGTDVAWAFSVPLDESDPADIVPGHVRVRFFVGGQDFPVLAEERVDLFADSGANMSVTDITAGDFDGDDITDIAVSVVSEEGDSHQVELWLLTRTSGLDFSAERVQSRLTGGGAPHVPITTGKLGSDHIHDIIWDGQVFMGSPDGLIPAESVPISDASGYFQFEADLDCDGINDLVGGDTTGAVIVSGRDSPPYLSAPPRSVALGEGPLLEGWRPAAVGDLNRDDVPDLVFVGGGQTLVLFGGDELVEVDTLHPWVAAAVVDLGGDGAAELAGTFVEVDQQPGGIEVLMGGQ